MAENKYSAKHGQVDSASNPEGCVPPRLVEYQGDASVLWMGVSSLLGGPSFSQTPLKACPACDAQLQSELQADSQQEKKGSRA